MRQIGRIKQVQIQRDPLKQGEKPYRYYDPAHLLVVEKLLLTPEGVLGITIEGKQLIDVHNARHPASRLRGNNGISLGFTSHYRAMRARFGPHLLDGCAGENILVETDEEFQDTALGERVFIQVRDTRQQIMLEQVQVAAPCVEFSHFALNEMMRMPAEIVREALIFLDGGRRGFYASFTGDEPCVLRAGDRVCIEE